MWYIIEHLPQHFVNGLTACAIIHYQLSSLKQYIKVKIQFCVFEILSSLKKKKNRFPLSTCFLWFPCPSQSFLDGTVLSFGQHVSGCHSLGTTP